MRRPPSRYLPHSYALMAVGAALTLWIVVQLVQYAQATYNGVWIFVAGLIAAAYVGLVVGILRLRAPSQAVSAPAPAHVHV